MVVAFQTLEVQNYKISKNYHKKYIKWLLHTNLLTIICCVVFLPFDISNQEKIVDFPR